MLNNLNFVTVGEDVRDQGDAFIRGEGTNYQALPRWNTSANGKTVRVMYAWFRS